MVAGLEEITRGTIRIGDRVVNDVPPKDRDIAMVFQNYALYPHMTVYKNMAFGAEAARDAEAADRQRVMEAAEDPGHRASAGAQAQGTLGRPAAARGGGAGDRPRAGGVSV